MDEVVVVGARKWSVGFGLHVDGHDVKVRWEKNNASLVQLI